MRCFFYEGDRIGGLDAGECDAPVRITWPSEVDAFKARILSAAQGYDASVKKCTGIPDDVRFGWNKFMQAFVPFATKPTDVFGSYGEWVTTCGYSRFLDAFATKLQGYGCKLGGPTDVSQGGAADILKWAAVGATGVAVAALIITFAPELKALSGFRTRR